MSAAGFAMDMNSEWFSLLGAQRLLAAGLFGAGVSLLVGLRAVLEIDRNAFQRIVAADPAVLEPISQLAARRLDAQREQRRAEAVIPPFDQDPTAQRLLQRIKAFFHL